MADAWPSGYKVTLEFRDTFAGKPLAENSGPSMPQIALE